MISTQLHVTLFTHSEMIPTQLQDMKYISHVFLIVLVKFLHVIKLKFGKFLIYFYLKIGTYVTNTYTNNTHTSHTHTTNTQHTHTYQTQHIPEIYKNIYNRNTNKTYTHITTLMSYKVNIIFVTVTDFSFLTFFISSFASSFSSTNHKFKYTLTN